MVTSSCLEFELEEEKFRLLLKTPENAGLWLENSTFSNKLNFFSLVQILIFLLEASQPSGRPYQMAVLV